MNKTAIKNYAIWARVQLIDAAKQRAYEYEITENGENKTGLDMVGGKLLTKTEKEQRNQLISEINRKGYTQVMEEAAYTWFNRFIALRFMEVNGYLPSMVRVFTDENGAFRPEILKQAISLDIEGLDRSKVLDLLDKQDNEELFKYLLITQCNALNAGLPYMFEKISNWTELLFPANLLRQDSVLGQMISEIPEEDWTDAVQIIGWLYQYYNSELKDETFGLLKKNIKITKERIPAATQLFTPDWIVRYMVENSLGRLWYEGHPDFDKSQWKYYLDEAKQEPEVEAQLQKIRAEFSTIKPEEIKVIDPCMGSGHILVYAFDVLMQIYTSAGWSERDAAKSVLENNLYGLDIDNRAGQLAYFAVMMKARKHSRRILNGEVKPNVISIQDSNWMTDEFIAYVAGNDMTIKADLVMLRKTFRDAKEYGSILNVPPMQYDALYDRIDIISRSFAEDLFQAQYKVMAIEQLFPLVKQSRIMSQKYDVVVTNPPYMSSSGMGSKLGDFTKTQYPDSKADMYAVFIEKCGSMLKRNGYQAMITQHTWMFIGSYESLREKVYRNNIINLVHLGIKAFEEIGNDVVQTCAFVLNYSLIKSYESTFVRLVDCKDYKLKEQEFLKGNYRNTSKCNRLLRIPGIPLAYWVSDQFIDNFVKGKSVERYGSFTGSQNITGDNERFLRCHWEVDNHEINKRWFFYAKGGDYRQYFGNLDLVIDWSPTARAFYTNNKTSNLLNKEYWYKEGITYSAITSRGTGFRYLPEGCLFDKGGPSINVRDHLYEILALFNSNVAKYYFWVFNPSINLQVKDVKNFPIIFAEDNRVGNMAKTNTEICEQDWNSYETASGFKKHPLI